VRAQTRAPLEVIVADDCSTDDTAAVARRLGARVVQLPRNAGPSTARNAGIAAASGEYVAFLDADDAWDPNHCETVAGLLDRTPSAGLAFSRVRIRGLEHKDTDVVLPPGESVDAWWRLIARNIVPQITVVARRTVLVEAGLYDEARRLSEDYDLWLRVAERSRFVFSDAVTATYMVHASQATRDVGALWAAGWDVRLQALDRLRQRASAEDVERSVALLQASWRREIRWAWNECSRPTFEAVLAAGNRIPAPAQETEQWRSRAARLWPYWVVAKSGLRATRRLLDGIVRR
jgi:glycosyltransferase involved in cell wall biosynthesis